jgi:hypothetical protein
MKKSWLSSALLFLLIGCMMPLEQQRQEPRVEVVFQNSEKFTDIKDSVLPTEKAEQETLIQLKEFIIDQSISYINDKHKLTIVFTDIDLAGDFEPWRGPEWSNVRIVKSIYPPRFCFTWQVMDLAGKVVKKGSEDIRDLAFDMRVTLDRNDPLHIEKDVLKDWMSVNLK